MLDRRHWLPESSVMILMINWIFLLTVAHFRTSATLSKVTIRTPRHTASMTWPRPLQGLAYMMSGLGASAGSNADISCTSAISPREAQSKLQPRLARVRTMAGSGLHLTA